MRFEGVALLGDTATVGAAYEFNQRLWDLEGIAMSDAQVSPESVREAFAAYRKARSVFYTSARASMGVPAADIPIESWTAFPWRLASAEPLES